jgi:hypothetical protein
MSLRSLPPAGVALVALALSACGEAPPSVASPEVPPPAAQVARESPTLQVAGPDSAEPAGQIVTLSASHALTSLGRFRAGDRVRIQVVEAHWTNTPGGPLFSAAGDPSQRCRGGGRHACLGGEDAAPWMGLVAVITPRQLAPTGCQTSRIPAGGGVEFEVPRGMEISLSAVGVNPGGWVARGEETTVRVETSRRRDAPAERRFDVVLSARTGALPVGHFSAGSYVRFTVLGPPRDAPSIVLETAICPNPPAPLPQVERRFLPLGGELVLERESDVSLGPNDWEDGLFDNEGFCRVAVEVSRR